MATVTSEPRPHLDERPDYEPRWEQERFIVPLLRGAIERHLAAVAKPLGPGGKALDVGCGRQPFRRMLEGFGFAYTGLDTQPAADGSVAHVAAIDGSLPPELVAEGPFQFVLCTEVLEHVADWGAAFANVARLTAPGGRVLLTCPHVYPLHEEPFDFWRPTPHAIRHYASRAGFRVASLEQLGDAWDVLGTVLAGSRVSRGEWSWKARVASLAVRPLVWLAYRLVRSGLVRAVPLRGKFYLSNVAVLERE
ncbi:MAG: class I SAM-dependent methyltransferase [Gemmataceae bacterium]|nr:class I SAM-dependent methyltransferase [Gemmataceae bacterium]